MYNPNNAPLSFLTGVPGWETVEEQKILKIYAQLVNRYGVIVEIGAEFGMSASIFCKFALVESFIYSVDLFPNDLLQSHLYNLEQSGFRNRSNQLMGDSYNIGNEWQIEIDLLFIDGDHSYEGVRRDIQAWIPHVKKDGVVLFHDCACETNKNPHELHYEVSKAVDEWYKESNCCWVESQSVDSIRIFRKIS